MYENNNKHKFQIDFPSFDMFKFKVKKRNDSTLFSIIIKFGAVCLFFFIFMFYVSRFGKSAAVDHDETYFNTNLTYIKNTLLDYYAKNNLPKIKGDSTSYTVSELIDENILNKSNIDNYEKCDLLNSYVVITKNANNMYNLKVSLLCNGINEELEYNFKK